jgi:hypothetical protein
LETEKKYETCFFENVITTTTIRLDIPHQGTPSLLSRMEN